jgi:hypothetical protein
MGASQNIPVHFCTPVERVVIYSTSLVRGKLPSVRKKPERMRYQ